MKKRSLLVIACVLLFGNIIFLEKLTENFQNQEVMISEICSRNQRVIYNQVGEYMDYIELYNPTAHSIDLSGYQISDRKDLKEPYVIEECTIESGQYKIIYPQGFGLSDNEQISLMNAENQVVDSVKIPVLSDDLSYAKKFDKNQWCIMEPTPERENLVDRQVTVKENSEIEVPSFSVTPGFYKDPFYLEIDAPAGTKIYYTVDGSSPTTESNLYEDPIYIEDVSYKENVYANIVDISTRSGVYIPYHLIDKTNIIRAVAVDASGNQSAEIVGSFFVGYEEKMGYRNLPIVSITSDPENLFGFEHGIYTKGKVWAANWDEERAQSDSGYRKNALANYRMEGKGWRRDAYLEVFGKDRQLKYKQEIEIGIHGGWSVSHNQKSFNLYACPEKDGKEYLCSGFISEKESTLMLRAGGYRDLFSTKFRDVLNHRLVENRKIGILRAIPCQVFLNGEYWGLYSFQERIDGCYVENNYGVPEENVIILKNRKVAAGEEEDYQFYESVLDFAANHDLTIKENYEKMKQLIDIESYIDYFCFQIYVANCDSVSNNYALWRSRIVEDNEYCDGRWRWILYDTDDSAGMVDSKDITQADVNTFTDGYWDISPMEDMLFSSLFRCQEFREEFAKTFVEMAEENFAPERVEKMIDSLCEDYAEGSVLSHQRFIDGDYSMERYQAEVNVVRDFFDKRPEYILGYLKDILEQYE